MRTYMPGRQSGEQAQAIPTPATPRPRDARQQANHYHAAAAAERRRLHGLLTRLVRYAAQNLEPSRRYRRGW